MLITAAGKMGLDVDDFSGWVRCVLLLSDAGWLKKSLDEKPVKTKPVILIFILTLPFLEGLKLTIPFIYRDWSG